MAPTYAVPGLFIEIVALGRLYWTCGLQCLLLEQIRPEGTGGGGSDGTETLQRQRHPHTPP